MSTKGEIAPYNIKKEKCDDYFVRQLEQLNVEIVAYQDGVGVGATRLEDSARYYENLSKAHQKAGRSRIWADMELFYFEQTTHGSLLPADFNNRIIHQMEAIIFTQLTFNDLATCAHSLT